MDILDTVHIDLGPITLREQLAALLQTVPGTTRAYLTDHPHLVDAEALDVLDAWRMAHQGQGDEASAEAIAYFRALLDAVWSLGVCAPLGIPAGVKPYPRLAHQFLRLDIGCANDLAAAVRRTPSLRPVLVRLALEAMPDVDWAILTVYAAHVANRGLLSWVQEYPILIDYEAELGVNLFATWAAQAGLDALGEVLDSVREGIHRIRTELQAGRLRLHDMPMFRLMQRFAHASAADALDLLRQHPEMLSDAGRVELLSWLHSAFVTGLVTTDDARPLLEPAVALELLDVARASGVDGAEDRLPVMPPAILVAGALCHCIPSPIQSWTEYRRAEREDPARIDTLAALARTAFSQNLVLNTCDGRRPLDLSTPPSAEERMVAASAFLLHSVLRAPVDEALDLLHTEDERVTQVVLLDLLQAQKTEHGLSLSDRLVDAFTAFARCPERRDLIALLRDVAPGRLGACLRNGSELLYLLGGLAAWLDDVCEMRLSGIPLNPVFERPEAVMMIDIIGERAPADLGRRLAPLRPIVERAARLGTEAALVGALADEVPLDERTLAILEWGTMPSLAAMRALVAERPMLLSPDVMDQVAVLFDRLSQSGDARSAEHSRDCVVWLHIVRRERQAEMIGDRWPRLTGPGVARAEQLIARLEVTLPAGVWTPVSRVDLTPDFFAVLEASIAAVSMHLGPEAARWLRAVADRAASWRGWFGECRAAHSHELAETVLRLLDDLPGEALHGLLEAEPELTCDEAADILADWLVTAVELGQMAAADRLRDRIALLDAARRTTVGTALLAHSLPGMSEDVRARMRNLLGTDSVADFVDRVETIRHGSLEALLAAQEELIDRYRAAGDPDTEDLIRRVRIQQLPLRLAQAVGQGDEAYRQLIASEPLFAAPDAITSLQRALSDWPPDLVAWHTREVRMQADPLLKAEREGTLSEAQRTALMHLQDGFLALCRATSWTERAALLCAREELRTETAILWAYSWRDRLLDRAGVDDAAVAADVEQMDEIIGFLERCGQAAPHVALCEMLAETCGTSRSERIFASLRLLTHLPARYARELESSRDDYLTRLDEAAREPGLTPADLAEIEAHIARYHLARYQTTRTKAVDLEQAIEHWRRALALCADDGVYAAQRRHDLGNCLLLRFEFHGHTMTDLAEAMSLLQDALGAPLPDAFRGPVLGDYARALTMRQEAYGTDEDLVEAINLLEEAIRITPEDSEHWIGWHLTLGGALGQWAEVSHQPEFLRGAIGVFAWMTNRAQPGSELWFWLSHNVAQSLLDYGRSEGAIDAIDAAIARLVHLTTCAASDPFLGLAHCALGRGWRLRYDLGREVGNLSRAVASFARAIELLPTDSPDLAFCLNGLALALDRLSCQGDSGAAEALRATYDRVLAMPWSGSWPHHIIDLAGNYGRWLLRQPDLAGARLAFERGIEALEWMRQTAADPRDALGYGEKHALFLAQLVHCCLELDDPASALKYACAAKARALAMQVARGVLAGVEADPRIATWQAEAADVRERLNYLRGLLRGEIDGHGRVLDAMVDGHIDQRAVGLEIRGLQTRESDLSRLTLRAGARDLPAGEAGLGGLDVARLQEQLGRADAVLVEYAQTLSGWGAFVVTANRVAFVPLPTDMPSWGIWRSRLRLARLQELPSEHLVRGVLRSIYDVFLAPVVDLLPAGKPLVLAPSGMMAMFPLAAAMRPDGRPMLDERPIVIVPSAAYLDVSAQRRYERVLAMSHVGVPGTPSFIPLADIEADLVGAAFHQAMRLAGDGLTPEGAAALASQVDVLHFACHGALDMEHPEATGMILPNGGYLNVLDLFGRISLAGASLAVLSACDVGTELPRPGDEHVSLVRGFLVAGVPAVVASLWPANDLSTMLLMTRFYGILHEGRGVAEALGAAQRWLRNLPLDEALAALKEIEARLQAQGCDEESLALFGRRLTLMFTDRAHPFAHPHHWASFQAYGAAL